MQTQTTKRDQPPPIYCYSTQPLALLAIYYLLSAFLRLPCSMHKKGDGDLCVLIPTPTVKELGKHRIEILRQNVEYIFALPYDPHELYLKIQQKYPIHKT